MEMLGRTKRFKVEENEIKSDFEFSLSFILFFLCCQFLFFFFYFFISIYNFYPFFVSFILCLISLTHFFKLGKLLILLPVFAFRKSISLDVYNTGKFELGESLDKCLFSDSVHR